MFPINLQKNIDQLGKQISLLENECKNMEMEKKKRNLKCQPPLVCKPSDNRMKAPPLRVPVRKTSCKKVRKSTPPASERLQPTGSQLSQCNKTWSENGGTVVKRRGLNIPVGSELFDSGQSTPTKTNRCSRCVCCNVNMAEMDRGDCTEFVRKGQVLHKEVLYQHPGGTIEVTVTQKPSNEKSISSVPAMKSTRKVINLEHEVEEEKHKCKCQTRGPKWADILSSDPSKKKQANSGSGLKNKVTDANKPVSQPLNLNNQKVVDTVEYYNNSKPIQQKESVKMLPQSYRFKQQSEMNTNKFEKETQCTTKDPSHRDPKQVSHVNALNFLFDQILNRPIKSDKPAVTVAPVSVKEMIVPEQEPANENKNNVSSKTSSQNGATFNNLKKPSCENLTREKEILAQELSAKDNMIAALKKREDDYLVLIANLKSSLEKIKGSAQEGADAVKEINFYKNKLLQQIKLTEALKQNHVKMQEMVERCTLENDKLKTQIKIYKLETQKHEVLLAGKEAQINRYKEEIQNFQRQISEHLTSLKSNAQEIDMEKMMEAIVHQTQLFTQLEDVESVLEKEPKDNSDPQNALMHSTPHSSPTSTKTSIVNSSWKRISSIHGHDLTKANSDLVVYLNDDTKRKGFFDVFKEKPQPKSAKEASDDDDLLDKKEPKPSSSFTSCLTGQEDQASSKSSRSLTSKESTNSVDGRSDDLEKKRISLEVAQSNIDRLLKDMKLKFSKEILDTSPPSCSTEDFPDISQISSMSPVH